MSDREFGRSAFDRFGEAASAFAGRSAFFTGRVVILVVWLVSYP
ncbi:MAG: hypothetical protein WB557_26080 [Solirubrobacteraceae bacterium]